MAIAEKKIDKKIDIYSDNILSLCFLHEFDELVIEFKHKRVL